MKTFLGKPVEQTASDDAGVTFAVAKKDYNAILVERGVTPEIQQTIKKADRDITFEAMKATGENTVKTGKDTRLELGSAKTCTTKAKVETRKPGAKGAAPVTMTVYGQFSVRQSVSKPGDKEFRETHEEIRERIAKKLSK
jgi:hypothetical protein